MNEIENLKKQFIAEYELLCVKYGLQIVAQVTGLSLFVNELPKPEKVENNNGDMKIVK